MASLAVLVPVLARPHRAGPLVESLAAATEGHEWRAVFLCSPGDDAEIAACRETEADVLVAGWPAGRADWARKIGLGFRESSETWVLMAADDLAFRPGWFDAAVRLHEVTGACVIGTNDLGNPRVVSGQHSTHPLVHRDYAECGTIDEDGQILHLGYHHNFVDDELVGTAKLWGTYAHSHDSVVAHEHPAWRKGEWDATYAKGQEHFAEDRALFNSRRHLWQTGTW